MSHFILTVSFSPVTWRHTVASWVTFHHRDSTEIDPDFNQVTVHLHNITIVKIIINFHNFCNNGTIIIIISIICACAIGIQWNVIPYKFGVNNRVWKNLAFGSIIDHWNRLQTSARDDHKLHPPYVGGDQNVLRWQKLTRSCQEWMADEIRRNT